MKTTDTVNVKLPVLARILLGELAERRGQQDEDVLVELIRREAVRALRREQREALLCGR